MRRPLGRVGRFELVQEIGRGAFATVYLARESASSMPVALKLLSDFDAAAAARFEREVELLVRLPPHPGTVRILDAGKHGGIPFLTMEYVPGGSLAAALEAGRWPSIEESLAFVAKVAGALAHL